MKCLKDMQLRGRENLIEMKPLTVKVEETGLEMRRPMRVRRMSTVKQMESILRLVHSWRWDELNKYQQDLIEMGNRGYRYFECVHPVSSEQPQTLGPLFDSIRKVNQIHRTCNRVRVNESKHFFRQGCGTTLGVQPRAIARKQLGGPVRANP